MDIADVKVGVFIKLWFDSNMVYKVVAVQEGGGVILRNTHNGDTFTTTHIDPYTPAAPAEIIREVVQEARNGHS